MIYEAIPPEKELQIISGPHKNHTGEVIERIGNFIIVQLVDGTLLTVADYQLSLPVSKLAIIWADMVGRSITSLSIAHQSCEYTIINPAINFVTVMYMDFIDYCSYNILPLGDQQTRLFKREFTSRLKTRWAKALLNTACNPHFFENHEAVVDLISEWANENS